MSLNWMTWDKEKPDFGKKVVVLPNDGASAGLFVAVEWGENSLGMIDAEDGTNTLEVYPPYFHGSIWCYAPDDFSIHFMNQTVDDWR